MSAGQYNFNDIIRGDTQLATGFTLKESDGVTVINLTGATIKVSFKLADTLIEKTIGVGVTVTDPTTGYFLLDAFAFTIHGKYDYDIEITYANGDIATILQGYINVKKDVSANINI